MALFYNKPHFFFGQWDGTWWDPLGPRSFMDFLEKDGGVLKVMGVVTVTIYLFLAGDFPWNKPVTQTDFGLGFSDFPWNKPAVAAIGVPPYKRKPSHENTSIASGLTPISPWCSKMTMAVFLWRLSCGKLLGLSRFLGSCWSHVFS